MDLDTDTMMMWHAVLAMWIGYFVMAGAGLALLIAAGWGLMGWMYRLFCATIDFSDVQDAVDEYHRNHPDRLAAFKRRHSIVDDDGMVSDAAMAPYKQSTEG